METGSKDSAWNAEDLLSELGLVRERFLSPEYLSTLTYSDLILLLDPDGDGIPNIDCVNRAFGIYAGAAFEYLTTTGSFDDNPHIDAFEKNKVLGTMHERLDDIIEGWLTEVGDLDSLAAFREDKELRKTGYSVLKVIRGMRCNNNCRFCLEQTCNKDQLAFIDDFASISYSPEDLLQSMLYARSAFDIKEINFSGGEPLVNKNKQLIEEIRMASEVGFPQITVITNGTLLSKELIDAYVDAGLTNLTVSIHSLDADNHTFLTRPKSGKNYHARIVEMTRYAATTGLIVRINAAMTRDYSEPIDEFVRFAEELGIQELTLNELIPANEFAQEQHIPIQDDTITGYDKVLELDWGLSLFKPESGQDGLSFAICRFGDKDFVEEQTKDIYLLPDGRLSPNLFDREAGISYKGI